MTILSYDRLELLSNLFSNVGIGRLSETVFVVIVGHCHVDVVRAGQRQMATQSTNLRYLHDAMMDYAEQLISVFPGDKLKRVFFVNSGLVIFVMIV